MINDKYDLMLLLATVMLVSCASSTVPVSTVKTDSDKIITENEVNSSIRDHQRFSVISHNKSLNDYAQQLLMELDTQQAIRQPVAVASFVEFDHSLKNTNSIGNQLAEAILVELGQLGYLTADINVDNKISMDERGNLVFSRQHKKRLNDYCCVVSGNLIYEQGGVRVNAKLIDLETRRILGASSLTIPYFVIEHLGDAYSE
jgi:TolB-like protein